MAELLITGDILYTLRHLAVDQVRALQFGAAQEQEQVASIRRIQGLRQALPDLVLVPGHDHTVYQFDHLVPFLANGELSVEQRHALKAYEAAVFEPWGELRDGARPRFVPAPDGGRVGTVVEPTAPAA